VNKQISLNRSTPVAGLGAVLFAHFAARFGNAGGGVPSPFEATGGDIAGYYTANSSFTAVSAYLYGLAAICLVLFAAGLWSRLVTVQSHDAHGWSMVGLVGTAIYVALLLALSLMQLALLGVAHREPGSEMIAGLAIVWAVSVALLVPGSVPMLLGFGMAGRRSGRFSGLLTGFALAGAALGLAPPPEVIGPLSPAAASLFFVLSEFQPWLLVFWILGTAFVIRRSELPVKSEAEGEPATAEDTAG